MRSFARSLPLLLAVLSQHPTLAQLGRTKEPVVVTGDKLPAFLGTPITGVFLYKWDNYGGGFQEIPFQIDEITLAQAFPYDNLSTRAKAGPCTADTDLSQLPDNCEDEYSLTGMGDGTLDLKDEIVFMARDAGPRAPSDGVSWLAGTDPIRYEIRVTDRLKDRCGAFSLGYVYAFRWLVTPHTPTNTTDYVQFVPDSIPDGTFCVPPYGNARACGTIRANPDLDGTVNLDRLEVHYRGNWLFDSFRVRLAGENSTRADLLDRYKLHVLGQTETEESWNTSGCPKFRDVIDGRVRVIRLIQGATSGVTTSRIDRIYDTVLRTEVHLRVHPINGLLLAPDIDTHGSMHKYNLYTQTAGEVVPMDVVDGVPPNPAIGQYLDWIEITGQQSADSGGFVTLMREPRPIRGTENNKEFDYFDDGQASGPEDVPGRYGQSEHHSNGPTGNMQDRVCTVPWNPSDDRICYADIRVIAYPIPNQAPGSMGIDFNNFEDSPLSVLARQQVQNVPDPEGGCSVGPGCTPSLTAVTPVTGDWQQGSLVRATPTGCSGVSGYNLYKGIGAGSAKFLATLGPSGGTYTDFAVVMGTTYKYTARAFNSFDVEGPSSSQAVVTILDATPPAAPVSVTATPGNTSATMRWASQTDTCDRVPGSNVYQSQSIDGPFERINAHLIKGAKTYTQYGLTNGRTYYFLLRDVDTGGNESANSAVVSVTPGS